MIYGVLDILELIDTVLPLQMIGNYIAIHQVFCQFFFKYNPINDPQSAGRNRNTQIFDRKNTYLAIKDPSIYTPCLFHCHL
jgi:hypothetical protein